MSIMSTLFKSRAQQEEIAERAALRAKADEKSKELAVAMVKIRQTCNVGDAAEEAKKMIEDAEKALVEKGREPRKEA